LAASKIELKVRFFTRLGRRDGKEAQE